MPNPSKQNDFEFRSPHGMIDASSKVRTFAGVTVRHMQHINHPGRAWHDLSDTQETLSVVLEEIGGRCEARARMNQPPKLDLQRPNHISFVPADMTTWAYSDNVASVRELRLGFGTSFLTERLRSDVNPEVLSKPRLMFQNQRALQIARLLAEDCDSLYSGGPLYGEGLTLALIGACFQNPVQRRSIGLASWQLRRATDFIHDHLDAPISLTQLAQLADLSSSQFARLFKVSTGLPAHRYQTHARTKRAQEMLLWSNETLSAIAAVTGFVDQSHFTRTFKAVTGATPNAWRRDRKC